ncbi:MAG: cell division protein FtsL [Gammaproteobacteria bacterium]|jgi:cell division protein FtsL
MSARAGQIIAVLLLSAVIVATGIAIVLARHEARQLFAELEALNREQDRLEVDWGRLRLEQSTYATHPRIEQLARDDLSLAAPPQQRIVVVAEQQP